MKHSMIRIALIAGLATPLLAQGAPAQTDDDFDVFGITNDGTSLDDLVPDTDELPPPQPYVEDKAEAPATSLPQAEPTAKPAVSDSVTPTDAPSKIATFDAPADWVSHTFKGFEFKAPPDWVIAKENSSGIHLFKGDMATFTGSSFAVLFERTGMPDEEEGVVFLSKTDVEMPNGEIYVRAEVEFAETKVAVHVASYVSPNTNEDDDYAIIALSAMNQPFENSRAILENILGTVKMPAKYVKPRDQGLGGLVTFDTPADWSVHHAPDDRQVSFRPQGYSGYGEIALGNWVTGEAGIDANVPANASAPDPSTIFGYEATLQTWVGSEPEFFVGSSAVAGQYTYYRLNQCLSDGSAVAVLFAGAPQFLERKDLAAVLDSVELTLPADLIDCTDPQIAAPQPTPAPLQKAVPAPQEPVAAAENGAFEAPANWITHKIRGFSFKAPEDWIPVVDEDDGLIVFKGDLDVPYGLSFGVIFEDKPGQFEIEGMVLVSQSEETMPNGEIYQRAEIQWRTESGARTHAVNYVSATPTEDGLYPWISVSAMNQSYDDASALLDNILSTVTMPLPSPVATAPDHVTSGGPASTGTQIDIEGASFVLPDGWNATYDSPSDKMFQSPDGGINLLAFWWFPDEPLTGYQDDITVKHVVIDHEPVTQITSRVGKRFTVQNVSERARPDEKRFIFTVESDSMTLEALQALNDRLIVNLRLQPAFDSNAQKPVVSPAPAPIADLPAPSPAQAPTLAPPPSNVPEAVRFGNFGDGLWQGEYVTLSNPGTGNPNGGGELDAIALGDGENGYFLAPAHLMGDWRAADAMQLVLRLKSGNGSYYGPYVDGGRGDLYLESGEMSASIEFDHEVGTEWTTQTVRFDDPQWQVSGAPSVRSILANVTRFDLRAEYLNGDTRSALASIDWISDAVAPRASKPGKTGKSANVAQIWQTYANARFGTRITYPTDLFTPKAAPDNNDGRSFAGIGGAQAFYVFGQSNFDALGVSALMERDMSLGGYSEVTYKTRGEDWYVLSGYLGKHIFYRKVLLDRANDILHVFEITYPADQKMAYNAIVTKMAASLSGP